MIYGFQFMGSRPEDINPNLLLESRDIGFPKKNKITGSVPFSNGEYDFSEIYGVQIYENRTIKYVIHVLDLNQLDPVTMHQAKTSLINWLENSHGRQRLVDDVIPDYHFLGEVRDAASLADDFETGELTVNFDCYPFAIKNLAEGNDDWDTFNFENDIAQTIEFDINGSISIVLINAGITIVYPEIESTGNFEISSGNTLYHTTTESSDKIPLIIGENYLSITGTGHLKFTWHKEVI